MESEILYHYTSLSTFVSIVKGGDFRLYDITKSNDPIEGKYAITALESAYKKLYHEALISDASYTLANEAYTQFYDEIFGHSRFSDLFAAASFCIPSHELSMLRWYGDNGRGVALGVPCEVLNQLACEVPGMRFRKVEYLSEERMEERARSFWMENLGCISSLTEENLSLFVERIKEYYISGYFIKHDANKDEEEYRLLYYLANLSEYSTPGKAPEICSNIDFSLVPPDDLKAYYGIDIKSYGKGDCLFSNLFIGPLCKVTATEMQMFLILHGIKDCIVNKVSWINMR